MLKSKNKTPLEPAIIVQEPHREGTRSNHAGKTGDQSGSSTGRDRGPWLTPITWVAKCKMKSGYLLLKTLILGTRVFFYLRGGPPQNVCFSRGEAHPREEAHFPSREAHFPSRGGHFPSREAIFPQEGAIFPRERPFSLERGPFFLERGPFSFERGPFSLERGPNYEV